MFAEDWIKNFRTALRLLIDADSLEGRLKILEYIVQNTSGRLLKEGNQVDKAKINLRSLTINFERFSGELGFYREIYYDRVYERHPDFIAKDDDIIFDIGANIGFL